jgi:hypothetical protein
MGAVSDLHAVCKSCATQQQKNRTDMQSKSKIMASVLRAGICAAIALGAVALEAQDQKVDPNGTWKWTMPGRNGNPGPEFSLKLKATGTNLTGTITVPARGGNGDSTDYDIADGMIVGDHISFDYVRDGRNGQITNKFEGKIAGDTITGTQPGGRGRRGGGNGGGGMPGGNGGNDNGGAGMATNATPPPPPAPTTRPWTATRSKDQ